MVVKPTSPGLMNFRENCNSNWPLWKQNFEIFMLASGKTKKADEIKVAIILNFQRN